MKTALSVAFVVLLAPLAAAQTPLELLSKVAANYTSLSKTNYEFEQVEVWEFSTSQNRSERHLRIAGSGGKYREETLPNGALVLSDGQFWYMTNADRSEYIKVSAKPGSAPGLGVFRLAAFQVKSARLLRQETLELAAGPVVCQVIEAETENTDARIQYLPITYWIDASRNLILKMRKPMTIRDANRPNPSTQIVTVSVLKATVGQPVDESLLRFTAPVGATEVTRLSNAPKSMLIGKSAPDFALKGANGQSITGSSLRGNVVLLRFTPKPDDEALLLLEMTYRSLKSKGLMAYHVLTTRMPPDPAINLFTVPVVTDPDWNAMKQFGLTSTGTILIDRSGKIVHAETSSSGSLELAGVLQKLGLW